MMEEDVFKFLAEETHLDDINLNFLNETVIYKRKSGGHCN